MHSPTRTLTRERLRVIAIIALAFLPLVLIETAIIGQQAQAGRDSIQAGRLALVRSAAGAADGFVKGNLLTLHALTQTRSIRGADADTVNAILKPIIQNDSNWLTIALSAGDGWNVSSLTTAAHSVNIADRDYFQAALAGNDGVGSVLVTRGTLKAKTIVLAVPVAFDDGTKGVLSGALSLANIEKQLNDVVPGTAIELRVIDRLGHQFIGPGSDADTLPDQNSRTEVQQGLAGVSNAIVGNDPSGRDSLIAFAEAARAGWVVVLSEPTSSAFALPDGLTRTAVLLTLVGFLAALGIAWYFGGRVARSYVALDVARAETETERFRLYEGLRHAPARVGMLLGSDLRYAIVSPAQLTEMGLAEKDVIGRPYREIDPDPSHRAVLEQVYRTGEPHIARETPTRTRLPNGATVEGYFNSTIVATRNALGAIDGVIYFAADVTDLVVGRKRVEELAAAVAGERDELQHIINELPEGVVLMRRDGAVTRNRIADELLGRPFTGDHEAAQSDYVPRRPNGTRYQVGEFPINRALAGEDVHGEEMIIHNPVRGEDLNILVSAAPVRRDGEIVAAVSVFQDISTLRAFERQRTEFFSMASHEIRTPVTAILLQLDLALRQISRGNSSNTEEMLRKARARTKALTALINDLLDVSRLDVGKFALELEDIDLASVVHKTIEEYPSDDDHPIRVISSGGSLPVKGDARRIVEVLENLLSNAVKYSPEGGAVAVEVGREKDDAVVRIRDEGLGVP
ncbi:MAG TPA: histidine kinase dimerization/phospho-acceptor domain-containing protein, partial [Candidatus Polarisedimenticolia bacterium]|nr:histidine kinase dimerization/phospho-acceptor domain-containing protein [Candidatus Polarisedimenticolia bacterium]